MKKIPKTYKPDKPKKHIVTIVKPKLEQTHFDMCWHGCDKVSHVQGMGGGGS